VVLGAWKLDGGGEFAFQDFTGQIKISLRAFGVKIVKQNGFSM
jgi:hypothetical protein